MTQRSLLSKQLNVHIGTHTATKKEIYKQIIVNRQNKNHKNMLRKKGAKYKKKQKTVESIVNMIHHDD